MSLNHSKRSLQSSSNSDTSPIKKKTKIALKRSFKHSSSSSSSSDEIDIPVSSAIRRNISTSSQERTSTSLPKRIEASPPSPPPPPQVPQSTSRIQIQRSSSSSSHDSNGSDEIVTKRTRQRRKKPTPSNERSTILKQMKRKTQERKNSATSTTTTTTITDNNNNMKHNDSTNSLNGAQKKCSFQFSDDEDDPTYDSKEDIKPHFTTTTTTTTTTTKNNNIKNDIDDGDTTESYEVEDDKEENHNSKNGNIKNEYDYDDDEEDDNSPTKRKGGQSGRKNIRKIIDDKQLDSQTKQAVEVELERRRRIAEKQKEYNDSLLEKSTYVETVQNEQVNNANRRLILELNNETNEALIEVSPKLVKQLKPHQCDGIRFLWNNVFESIEAIENKKQGNGCILAHCMGLGKTLQVISFIHTIFNYDKLTNVRTCLVLCPINAALNWTNEFEYWLNDIEPPVDNYQLTTIKANLRVTHLNYWYEHGGVMIMGYEMYRRLANGFGLKSKKIKAQAYKCLVDPGPDIIVADEGHILKNSQTALAKCLTKIKTYRRIVLTGTPLQNNLIEYYCMVSFIKPNLLGSQQEYVNRFVNPIQNGQHRDSNEADVRLMKRRACVLHELLTGFIDRKDYGLLRDYLPPKFEYIINIRLSDLQTTLYDSYLKRQGNLLQQQQNPATTKKDFKSVKLFADYQYLQKIWTHPFLLYPHFIDHWKKRLNKEADDFLDDSEFETMFTDEEDEEMEEKKKNKKKSSKKENEKKKSKKKSLSGFLIDNVGDEDEEGEISANNYENSKSQKRTVSKSSNGSSVTTVESGSYDDDDGSINGLDSDAKSKSGDDNEDPTQQVEIVKNYRTRSRTAAKIKEKQHSSKAANGKNLNLAVFDTGNDNVPTNESTDDDDDRKENPDEPWLNDMREQFWFPFLDMLPDESEFDTYLGGKIVLLKAILDKCAEIGDKILLFSRSLYALNYIERFLYYLQKQNEEEYRKECESRRQLRQMLASNGTHDDNNICGYVPKPVEWIRDQDYFRMDGQTDVTLRKRYAKEFNDESNLRARLFLISTLAGGIGINLVGSNRVIVFDASWNPSHDTQAIFRSYRFGQKKPVYIYRFLAQGTMEEKIYQRQVVKQSLSQRVIDDHQLDRHFTENDIKELYKFTPEQLPEARQISTTDFNYAIPKDHLLLDLLYEHNQWIHSYHSHDSLLENKLDEGLTEEERRKALEEYENLKRLPDARQLAAQRLQNQQLAAAPMAQIPQLQQMYLEFLRSMSSDDQQNLDYSKILQYAYEFGLGQQTTDTQATTTSDSNKVPKTSTDTSDVVLLESDDDDSTAKAE
ncbi:unnamed protein product [Rotaria magnacalcarata]|uniref:Transcriptional regulator ATRX homolog n=18 Tax=Rotaria magnacalcarata TaxID=392030 RepID=A0A816S0D1_9BILA|nr:unnamed protein product [Rotaria magnacalcarata]CAF1642656.1 unnamed protein product [Rotaria magnacalcarata]CAF2081824.1 unnamed protein product [Rotaria magnacalcarata]